MLKKKKKNKLNEMGKSWELIDSHDYLKFRNPERLATLEEGFVFPFYIRLLEKPLEGWIIEVSGLEDDGNEASFVVAVDLVPKEVTQEQYDKRQKPLKKLLSSILNDILEEYVQGEQNGKDESKA